MKRQLPEHRWIGILFHRNPVNGTWDMWESPVVFTTLPEAEEWKREATKMTTRNDWYAKLYFLDDLGQSE